MNVWIDDYGDVVWYDPSNESKAGWIEWTDCLNDGCRLNKGVNVDDDRINGLWMVLE